MTYRNIPDEAIFIPLRDKQWSEVEANVADEVGSAFILLQSLETALLVVGANESSSRMASFRRLASNIQTATSPYHLVSTTVVSVKEFEKMGSAMNEVLQAVTAAL